MQAGYLDLASVQYLAIKRSMYLIRGTVLVVATSLEGYDHLIFTEGLQGRLGIVKELRLRNRTPQHEFCECIVERSNRRSAGAWVLSRYENVIHPAPVVDAERGELLIQRQQKCVANESPCVGSDRQTAEVVPRLPDPHESDQQLHRVRIASPAVKARF